MQAPIAVPNAAPPKRQAQAQAHAHGHAIGLTALLGVLAGGRPVPTLSATDVQAAHRRLHNNCNCPLATVERALREHVATPALPVDRSTLVRVLDTAALLCRREQALVWDSLLLDTERCGTHTAEVAQQLRAVHGSGSSGASSSTVGGWASVAVGWEDVREEILGDMPDLDDYLCV